MKNKPGRKKLRENETTHRIPVYLPENLFNFVDSERKIFGVKQSTYVRNVLEKYRYEVLKERENEV